jgi:hypothetical protein
MELESVFDGQEFYGTLNSITVNADGKSDKDIIEDLSIKLKTKQQADSGMVLVFSGERKMRIVEDIDSITDDTIKGLVTTENDKWKILEDKEKIIDFEDEMKSFENSKIPFIILTNYQISDSNEVSFYRIETEKIEKVIDEGKGYNLIDLLGEEGELKDLITKVNISGSDQRSSSNRIEKKCMGKISVAETMALFSILTAIAHIIIGRNPTYFVWIEKDQINYIRWVEYSITSAIMVFGLAGLCGITQSEELVPIAILTGVTNIFGLGIEAIKNLEFYLNYYTPEEISQARAMMSIYPNDVGIMEGMPGMGQPVDMGGINNSNLFTKRLKTVKKILFVAGCITHSYPWARILWKLNKSINSFGKFDEYIKNSEKGDELARKVFAKRLESFSKIRPFIIWATWGLAAIYWSFPINMITQQFLDDNNPTYEKYYKGEVRYILLSMVAKSFLTWIIWSGSLRDGEGPRRDLENC